MNSIEEQIAVLTVRIQELAGQQNVFQAKLQELLRELELLKAKAAAEFPKQASPVTGNQETIQAVPLPEVHAATHTEPAITAISVVNQQVITASEVQERFKQTQSTKKSAGGLEEFLGKNLASKVGILVTVIGVFIGAKYAVENNLVSESLRIVLGYLAGNALIAIAYRLRTKYPAYSAVLMGGGLCVVYIITYIAFTYYHMFPRMVAFGIMVGITAGIVYAALVYNRVIIAHLAMVGAYAIPFLLSDNSGNYAALFSYIAIINTGIAVISFRKYWKSLLYASFLITWFIFGISYLIAGDRPAFEHIAWPFLIIYFVLFYTSLIAYKLLKQEKFALGDILLLIPNALIFYGLGMAILERDHAQAWEKGVFTLLNALVHFGVSVLVRKKLGMQTPLYSLLIGLTITFTALAVPVALDGKWVMLIWAAQSLLLYWMGRKWKDQLYLHFSIVMTLFTILALYGWYLAGFAEGSMFSYSERPEKVTAFLNEYFLTAILVLATCMVLIWFERNQFRQAATENSGLAQLFYAALLPALTMLTSYGFGFIEIRRWFLNIHHELKGADGSFGPWAEEVSNTGDTAALLYSFAFGLVLLLVNLRWYKNQVLRIVLFNIFLLLTIIWMLMALPLMNQLSVDYYQRAQSGFYFGGWNLLQRYAFLALIAAFLYYYQPRFCTEANRHWMKVIWPLTFVVVLTFALSFEYLLWTKVSGANNQYKYGLSVLWGLLALALIVYGIWKKNRIIRLMAMVMLVITLIKLVFFDLSNANSLTRTITYIALGGILLLISYLYNRYKELLFGKDEAEG